MMATTEDLSYTAERDGRSGTKTFVVWRNGERIGRVRRGGFYWYAATMAGERVHGTFMSMSAAAKRVAEHVDEADATPPPVVGNGPTLD